MEVKYFGAKTPWLTFLLSIRREEKRTDFKNPPVIDPGGIALMKLFRERAFQSNLKTLSTLSRR